MKLYCMRHGEAALPEVDPQRGLTENGLTEVQNLSSHLMQNDLHVAQVIHSGIFRAKQTAEILSNTLQVSELTASPELLGEHANVQALIDMLSAWTEDTVLVGHLPFMFQLLNALVIGDMYRDPIVNFTPATIVCLDQCHDHWVIQWVLNPQLIS